MDSSSSSRFRFRDHQEMGESSESDTSSEISSVSSDRDNESEPESMTGKGIKRLCSELLELKKASDEDFHRNIFSNYSAFLGIFEEVGSMENELIQLKHHVTTQKKLIKDLIDGIYLKALSQDTLESIIEEPVSAVPSTLSKLEAHTNNVLETLDTLLSEHRLDEALAILEMEPGTFQMIQLEENSPPDVVTFYNSAMLERKTMLANQLTLVAENPRVPASELQKALVGLSRLGDSHLATQLLLKYYHSRIASGTHQLQCSKSFLHGIYMRELSKFVFSMISQAARSFVLLYGETSPYASELIQWACEETEVFASCFNKYVKSISEISGGLSTAVEAVQFAMSYCSLLKTQRIVLLPCLIKHIRPCMEEVLQIHLKHFKKVIGIFAAIDVWVLGRYLVSGILNDGCSLMVVGQHPEYCLLTNSGRKFVTLLQAITEDVFPLVTLQMEGSILRGLSDLFMEYIIILEKSITCERNVTEKSGSRINLADSLPQQVSILANTSTLVHFFSSIVRNLFNRVNQFNRELMKNYSVGSKQKDLDSCILLIQEASCQLRAHFCQRFIYKMMSVGADQILAPETCVNGQTDCNMFPDVMPSAAFQVLFLELRKLEKLAEENVVEVDWLMELLRELMEAILARVSSNKEIWTISDKDSTVEHSSNFKQFVLDMEFLVEIARHGGYLSNNIMNASSSLVSRLESAFLFAGLDPKRDVNDDGWAINTATEAIQKLLEMEKTKMPPNEEPVGILKEEPDEHQSEYANYYDAESSVEDSIELEVDIVAINASAVSNKETEILNAEVTPVEGSLDFLEESSFDATNAITSTDTSVQLLENMGTENAANTATDELQNIGEAESPVQLRSGDIIGEASQARILIEEETSDKHDGSKPVSNEIEDSAELQDQEESNVVEIAASTEDFVELQGLDEINNLETAAASVTKNHDKIQSAIVGTLVEPEDNDGDEMEGLQGINCAESRGEKEGHTKINEGNVEEQLVKFI